MKALITGASGLLGNHLLEYLEGLDEIVSIIALVRSLPSSNNYSNKVTFVKFNLTHQYTEYSKLDEYDDFHWFHLAAALSGADRDRLEKVNIEGTRKLLRKATQLGVPRFIHISSISTYGVNHSGSVKEEHPQKPGSRYGQSKLKQELLVKQSTIPWTIIRPPYIIGPGDRNFLYEITKRVKMKKMHSFSRVGVVGYIDARDLAKALHDLAISDKTIGEVYNIQGGKTTMTNIVSSIGDHLEIDPPYGSRYNFLVIYVISLVYETFMKLQGKSIERGLSRYRLRTLTGNHTLDTEKIKSTIDFQPEYSLEQSIHDYFVKSQASD